MFRYFFAKQPVVPNYHREKTLEERKAESEAIRRRYPGYIPIVVQPSERKANINLHFRGKKKFLVPATLYFGAVQYIIRKRLNLPADKTLYYYTCDNIFVPGQAEVFNLYEEKKDSDGYLYIIYSVEDVFG